MYVNDHTAVLVDNSQRKIDTLEPRLWDEFNTGVNYYNTGNKVRILDNIYQSWEIENHYLEYLIDILGNDFQFPMIY